MDIRDGRYGTTKGRGKRQVQECEEIIGENERRDEEEATSEKEGMKEEVKNDKERRVGMRMGRSGEVS